MGISSLTQVSLKWNWNDGTVEALIWGEIRPSWVLGRIEYTMSCYIEDHGTEMSMGYI